MPNLIQEKVNQAVGVLRETGVELWLIFVRETTAGSDPILPLIYGHDLTWQSALLIESTGERIAIIGSFEAETARRTNAYSKIIPYHEAIRPILLSTLNEINPHNIAIDYSKSDVLSDGLSFGLYQVLLDYLEGSPYKNRLISAEPIIARLRGRKTPTEVARIKNAIQTTQQIYSHTFDYAQAGMSEIQVSDFMHAQLSQFGVEPAWEYDQCPIVNTGPASSAGHVGPSELALQPGSLLHIDFGVRQDGYCSDIQRQAYFLAPGEESPPGEVQRGFDTVVRAIQAAFASLKPGIPGKEVDRVARRVVTDAGYSEFMHATGHHLGMLAHDGAGVLGPLWERYGDTPNYLVEAGHVYTLEPSIVLERYGTISVEEDVLVTENGAVYLSNPQTELVVKRAL